MEIQHAKIILSNFRPNGQDAEDADFAEALALAAQSRELGAWLAGERAKDAAFSDALNSVSIPDGLRDEILAALNQDVLMDDDPELDKAFFGAFADVQAPEGLRDQILVAMDQEQKVVRGVFPMWKVMPYAAAAVAVLVAVFLLGPFGKSGKSGNSEQIVAGDAKEAKILAFDIQQDVGQKLVNKDIHLVSNSFEATMNWLKAEKLPVAKVPDALKSMQCLGATKVELGEGVEASMVRFLSSNGKEVNMLVIAKKNVRDVEKLPGCKRSCAKDSYFCPKCDYWIARMKAEDSIVILLSKLDQDKTTGIF